MKESRSRASKKAHKKETEFKKMYEKRMRAESELRYVTKKLQRAHEWLPLLAIEQPRKKPAAVLKALRKRQSELLGTIKELQQKGIGRRLWRRPSTDLPPRTGLPDKDKIRQMGIIMQYLDRLRRRRKEAISLSESVDLQAYYVPEDVKARFSALYGPSALIQRCDQSLVKRYLIQSDKLTKYPAVMDFGHKDRVSDTEFNLELSTHVCKIVYDGSFISPTDGLHSFLGEFAALEFEIPPPICDSYIHYEVPMELIVSANTIAGLQYVDLLHVTRIAYYEQPDANVGAPQSGLIFKSIRPTLSVACTNESTMETKIHSWDPFEGMFFVRKGVPSKVHIGLQTDMIVWGGIMFAWDQLSLFRPSGEDIWGLKVTVVPA